ncbi:MAG: IS110 family transposase [Gaiellales bacterium]
MITIGVDSHKRTHTVVAADGTGRKLAEKTVIATSAGHLELVRWAARFAERTWALEDCRHLSRRLSTDLLVAGEAVVRVPPKLMAGARRSSREPGKSDPIDALAVARAALREDLPAASLDGPDREVRLLVDHREDLVAERTRAENRLRWHLHELDPGHEPGARSLDRMVVLAALDRDLATARGTVGRLARELAARIRELTVTINELEREIARLVADLAPSLLALVGCGPLTAAKLVGETAGIGRFRSRAAFARHNGSAPLPVWSSNTERHRLSRTGNRQLNVALHRIAITQLQREGPGRTYLEHRRAQGDTKPEAIRALRRQISNEVFRRMRHDEAARAASSSGLAVAA